MDAGSEERMFGLLDVIAAGVVGARQELHAEIGGLRGEMHAEIGGLRRDACGNRRTPQRDARGFLACRTSAGARRDSSGVSRRRIPHLPRGDKQLAHFTCGISRSIVAPLEHERIRSKQPCHPERRREAPQSKDRRKSRAPGAIPGFVLRWRGESIRTYRSEHGAVLSRPCARGSHHGSGRIFYRDAKRVSAVWMPARLLYAGRGQTRPCRVQSCTCAQPGFSRAKSHGCSRS